MLRQEERTDVFGGGEALLFKALLDTATLALLVGDDGTATHYNLEAEQVKEAINTHFWDPTKGCYLDPRPPHTKIGHRCNAISVEESLNSFAMLYGIADADQARSVTRYLQNNLW